MQWGMPRFPKKTLRICDKQRKCHRSRDFAADERCTGTCEKKQSGVTLEPEVKMIERVLDEICNCDGHVRSRKKYSNEK